MTIESADALSEMFVSVLRDEAIDEADIERVRAVHHRCCLANIDDLAATTVAATDPVERLIGAVVLNARRQLGL